MRPKPDFSSGSSESESRSDDSLARRYYAPLLSFFRKRTRNASDTQDLVQQVFLRLAQSRQNSEIHNPDAYIFQTAANALRAIIATSSASTRHGCVFKSCSFFSHSPDP